MASGIKRRIRDGFQTQPLCGWKDMEDVWWRDFRMHFRTTTGYHDSSCSATWLVAFFILHSSFGFKFYLASCTDLYIHYLLDICV